METDFTSIVSQDNLKFVEDLFGTEINCENFLFKANWPKEIISPFDVDSTVYLCSNGRYRCKNTKKYFNVKTNTLFHNSKVPLSTWFKAIWIVANSDKLTSVALAAELQLTQKTAWYMLRRIKRYLNQTGVKVENKRRLVEVFKSKEVQSNPDEKLGLSQWLEVLKNTKEKGFN